MSYNYLINKNLLSYIYRYTINFEGIKIIVKFLSNNPFFV